MATAAGDEATATQRALRHVAAADGPPLLDGRMLLKVSADESLEQYTLCLGLTPPGLGPPLHCHELDDQTHYVVRGTYELIVGPEVVVAGPGAAVHMPRFTPHTFRNVSDEPAEIVELTAPGGIDRYFQAVAHLGPVAMDLEARNEVGRPYGMSFPEDPAHVIEPPPGETRRAATFVGDDGGRRLDWDGCVATRKIDPADTDGSHSLTEIALAGGGSVALPPARQLALVVVAGSAVVNVGGEEARAEAGGTVAAFPADDVIVTAGVDGTKLVVYAFADAP
jgi:mannose-6-phosphate isomerase-like protein (cupin superfamily)